MPTGIGAARSETNDALIEFGKKVIVESVTTINEYIKMMIPLTTGLITSYFALLEFLGIKDILKMSKTNAIAATDPTIFMLLSLISFILTLIPLVGKLELALYDKINDVRKILIIYRYGGMAIGMGFFLYGIYLMIHVIKTILENVR